MFARFSWIVFLCVSGVADAKPAQTQTVLITAATGSLGSETALHLAEKGYGLILCARDSKKLHALQQKIHALFPKTTVTCAFIDFSNLSTVHEAAKKLQNVRLNGVVLIGPRPCFQTPGVPSAEEWTRVFSETFVAPLEVVRSFEPCIDPHGSVVIVSGDSSKMLLPHAVNTNVMRLAWLGEAKNLVSFFKDRRIRVNTVSPGALLTPFHHQKIQKQADVSGNSFQQQMDLATAAIPLKKYGDVADFTHLVSFLLSSDSKYINGTNSVLDGGLSPVY